MGRAQLDVDLFTPELIKDPYPRYEEVRAAGNVVWNALLNGWMVVGYDEGTAALSDVTRAGSASVKAAPGTRPKPKLRTRVCRRD